MTPERGNREGNLNESKDVIPVEQITTQLVPLDLFHVV